MKLSELVREYIDLKIEGEPNRQELSSSDASWQKQQDYHDRLKELEAEIDSAITASKGK